MSWLRIRFKRAPGGALLVAVGGLLLAGCSFFSTSVSPLDRSVILDKVPPGLTADAAESAVTSLDFRCTHRSGSFYDEDGREHQADQFLSCVKAPRRISFECENRDQVYVVLKGGISDQVYVARGPTCVKP